jgi:hypothetical protein
LLPAQNCGHGSSPADIAGLLGHWLQGITARYAHMPDRALLTAADQVSARLELLLREAQEGDREKRDHPRDKRDPAAIRCSAEARTNNEEPASAVDVCRWLQSGLVS